LAGADGGNPLIRLRGVFGLLLLAAVLAACRKETSVATLGIEPRALSLPPGSDVGLRFDWRPVAALDKLHGRPTVFVHLLDRDGALQRTFDHSLPSPWKVGDRQAYEIDLYQSLVADELPSGTYSLHVGLYDDSWGYRWPLQTGGKHMGMHDYLVGTVEVPAARASGTPPVRFEGDWLPVERGTDQQVIARRYLQTEGSLRLDGPAGPGILRAKLLVPPQATGVRVTSDCVPGPPQTLAPGLAWTGISVNLAAGSSCAIRFSPTSARLPAAAGVRRPRTVSVEVLAWRSLPR
jgi:hypothetical protein